MKCKCIAVFVLAVATALSAQSRYVRTDGQYLVARDGHRLLLRGTNLGN